MLSVNLNSDSSKSSAKFLNSSKFGKYDENPLIFLNIIVLFIDDMNAELESGKIKFVSFNSIGFIGLMVI